MDRLTPLAATFLEAEDVDDTASLAIGSFAMGRGFGKWVFTAIGLLMVSGVTRLLEYWISQGTAGVT